MKRFILCSLLVVLSFTAEARKNDRRDRGDSGRPDNGQVYPDPAPGALDADIIRAMNGRKKLNFVEGGGMVVTKVLPDDTSGLQHQKWFARLSDGREIEAVYNSDKDLCPRVPIKVGDVVSMGGMFLWLGNHGMIHWLHHDPRGNRPDGYVEIDGKFYCKDSN